MKLLWNIWPLKNYAAITTPWGIYFNPSVTIDPVLIRHEEIHQEQIKRVGMMRFYSQYVWEYFLNLIHFGEHGAAYRNISFEVEAYKRQWADSVKEVV